MSTLLCVLIFWKSQKRFPKAGNWKGLGDIPGLVELPRQSAISLALLEKYIIQRLKERFI